MYKSNSILNNNNKQGANVKLAGELLTCRISAESENSKENTKVVVKKQNSR